MSASLERPARPRVVEVLYYLTAVFFFVYLFAYFWTSEGGPVLLAITLVPVTFVLFTLDELRKDELYPRLRQPGAATESAVAVLVRGRDGTVEYLSPLKQQRIRGNRA